MVVLNLVTAIGAVGGGVATGDTSGMVSAGKAAKVEVENNSVSEAADYLATGKKPEDRYKDAQQQLKDAVDDLRRRTAPGSVQRPVVRKWMRTGMNFLPGLWNLAAILSQSTVTSRVLLKRSQRMII
ncbi:VENN motif pre-toxin domain-containing protein, partial [Atlantibacter sp.]|uniref:VENN motif pre-toxin domain-containing protein n=1 Tax=Atlantibacter sp. TaxID=1903473 RepID=UPI00289BCE53